MRQKKLPTKVKLLDVLVRRNMTLESWNTEHNIRTWEDVLTVCKHMHAVPPERSVWEISMPVTAKIDVAEPTPLIVTTEEPQEEEASVTADEPELQSVVGTGLGKYPRKRKRSLPVEN